MEYEWFELDLEKNRWSLEGKEQTVAVSELFLF